VARCGAYTYFDATLPEKMATRRMPTTATLTIRMSNEPAAAAGARSTPVLAGGESTRYFGGADLR
jgi:hypothetical protein